jgi:hypothetical protein
MTGMDRGKSQSNYNMLEISITTGFSFLSFKIRLVILCHKVIHLARTAYQ